jgi:ATP-dependent helicase/nuclease subunit A
VSSATTLRLESEDRLARVAAQTVFDRPVVLEAGAGTGKTTALVGRVIAWALGPGWEGAAAEEAELRERAGRPGAPDLERVAARALDGTVAITFTDAAAAEMASRVGAALRELAAGRLPLGVLEDGLVSDAATRRLRAHTLLTALDHLRVSTIHAFCRRLLAANPLEAGIHPAFRVDADERLTEAVAQAVVEERYRRALGGDGDPDVLGLAAAGVGPDRILASLMELVHAGIPGAALGDGEGWRREAAALLAELGAAANGLAALLAERSGGSRRLVKAVEIAEACRRVGEAIAAPGCSLGTARAAIETWLDDPILSRLREWRRGALTASESEAFGRVAERLAELAGAVLATATSVRQIDEELHATGSRVLGAWLEETRARLRREGVVGFGDLLRGCRDLLVSEPGVAARERRAIRQLLVDEFQDTDAVQCEILAVLGLGGPAGERPGVFLVGDPKQSIYGWRQADLAAYQSFVGRVLGEGGELHRLSVNFRSVAAVLDEVERAVRPVMGPEPGVQPAFEPLLVGPPRRDDRGFGSAGRAPVEYWITPALGTRGEVEEVGDIEPRAVAADIRDLHDRHGVAWGDFAILMRSTGELDDYLHALREAAVPYVVERDRSYYRRREVIDASALIRAVIDPLDHLALLTWMRSATVGVPDAALLPLWRSGFPDLATELRTSDAASLAEISAVIGAAAAATPAVPGLERVQGWEASLVAAMETLARLRESFAADPVPVFIERLRTASLLEATEAARVLGSYRVANLDRLFRSLLEEVDRRGGDPEAILATLRRAVSERREEEEGRLREHVTEAVRVMTIHKAKGLDFGHVYLVNADRTMLNERLPDTGAAMHGVAWQTVLFGAPSPGWRHVVARRRRIAEAELVRTLYVALTRAKRRLVIAGRWDRALDGAGALSHLSLLARRSGGVPALDSLAAPALECGARWVPLSAESVETSVPVADVDRAGPPGRAAAEEDERALEAAASAARLRMARPYSGAASSEAHRLVREGLAGAAQPGDAAFRIQASAAAMEAATAAGTAVHALLERLDFGGDVAAQITSWPAALALSLRDRPEALRRADQIVGRLASSPLSRRLAALAGAVLARELPVIVPPSADEGPVGAVIGAVDLLYREPATGELVIADFKTDRVEGEALAARAHAYRPQLETYARAIEWALGLPAPPAMELWFLHAGIVRRL